MFRRILFFILLPFCAYGKIYDCFTFFNEIELLKMRLEELNDSVDYFVLVESIETHKGDLKKLIFQENRQLFEKYLPKIIYVAVEERHPELGPWKREAFQRNCILRGLKNCEANDIIIISDLDEIPRPSVVAKFKELFASSNPSALVEPPPLSTPQKKKKYEKKHAHIGAFALQMDNYCYQLNRAIPITEPWGGGNWYGTIVTTYAKLSGNHKPQYYRQRRDKLPRIRKGGWHFTWMGGREKVRVKHVSVVEGRADGHLLSDAEIDQAFAKYPIVPIDDSFPTYIQKNLADLKSQGFIADY